MEVAPWKVQFSQFKDSTKSLVDVLLSGELPLADYIKWATEKYKVPFVNDNFFAQTNNFKLLTLNPHAKWNSYFFPIHEWQGMLYIGCLEPQALDLNKKAVQVLCSPKQLSLLWAKMEKVAEAPMQAPVVAPIAAPVAAAKPVTSQTPPPPVKPVAPTPQASAPRPAPVAQMPTSSVQKLNTMPPVPAPKPTLAAPVQPQASPLSGLSKFVLEDTKSELSAQVLTETQTETKTVPNVAAPKVAPAPKPLQAQALPPKTAPTHQEPIVVPTSHLQSQGVNVNPNYKESNFDIPEITNVVRSVKPKSNDTNFTSTKTIMPFPDRTTQFTFIRTVYSDQVIIDSKAKIQENSDPQDALISAFRILKDYYKKLMWVVRDQKGLAFPIACNSEWDFSEEAWNLAMDFKTPNPFRIAKLTQKPFHGPVSKNRASDQFFKQWGDGSYPDVMSVVPVKLHGKVFGYFVGCGKGPHFQQGQSIELMESVCNELIEAFIRIHKELAKAA